MTPPPDPEVSRQIGRLEGGQRAIERSIAEMAASNSREHAEVLGELRGIREDVAKKADNTRVDNHANRIRDLEGHQRQGSGEVSGAARTLRFLQGAIALAIALLGYLAGKGSL